MIAGSVLGGCSPIEGWRSVIGVAKNDPDPETAPFTQNLAAGEAEPYPNLASVPPPPNRATSTAERQKLTQSLIADRSATEAAGGLTAPGPGAMASTPATAPPSARSPGPADDATPPRQRLGSAAQPQSGIRKAGEPPAPQPLESSLTMPQIPSVPQPEAARPAPPPPALPAVSSPAPSAETAPAAIASATPLPPPSAPDLAPIEPPPAATREAAKRAPTATTVATLELSGAAEPSSSERAQIERVAALYKDKPSAVRVLAYAAAPAPGSDPLAGYRAALDRAQAVAKALADTGIPANKIQTEAAPALSARGTGRVEIQFAQ